ncbi:MAG: hypothetical protein QXP12_07945 [Ignisphaera sp.]
MGIGNIEPFTGLVAMESKCLLSKYPDGAIYVSIAVRKKDPGIWSWRARARICSYGWSSFPNQIINGFRFSVVFRGTFTILELES